MKVVLLAGGLGTRLQEETTSRPKPMVEVGGYPMLWHIMKSYAACGFNEFVVALGYKGAVVKDYFLNYAATQNDLSIELSSGKVAVHDGAREDWIVHLVDTGLETQTGGRIKRLERWLGAEPFMLTYGDGVADLDFKQLLRFHQSHGRLATVTAVRPPARFGGLSFQGERVTEVVEKPQIGEGWINGGFFVLEPGIFAYIADDATYWEREPMEQLAAEGQLMAYRHEGFWQCMDTLRDVRLLEALWQRGEARWRTW